MKSFERAQKYSHWRQQVKDLSDGIRKSREIAEKIGQGCTAKYVQNVWRQNPKLKRPKQAPPCGECNPSYTDGKTIDRDGYVLVACPADHWAARSRKGRNYSRALEHRVMAGNLLGRALLPHEVVDHINGCKLDNSFENLRVFGSNAKHLRATISGQVPHWSKEGYNNMNLPRDQRKSALKIDTYNRYKKAGVIRLREILHAHVVLDTTVHDLSYTQKYIEKAGVDLADFLNSRMSPLEYLEFSGHLERLLL